jgi:hypothetical protein
VHTLVHNALGTPAYLQLDFGRDILDTVGGETRPAAAAAAPSACHHASPCTPDAAALAPSWTSECLALNDGAMSAPFVAWS